MRRKSKVGLGLGALAIGAAILCIPAAGIADFEFSAYTRKEAEVKAVTKDYDSKLKELQAIERRTRDEESRSRLPQKGVAGNAR